MNEARYRAMFEQASVGIVQVMPDGRMELPNPGFCAIIGRPEDEVRRLTVREVTHPEDYGVEADLTHRLLAESIPGFTLEKRYVRGDGGVIWGEMTASLVRRATGEPDYILAIIEDITERRQAEAALRASEESYRTLVENIVDYAIFRVDPEGIITEWTDGARRVKGYTAQEAVGQHLALFYTPDEIAAGEPARELAEAARTGRAEREAWRVRKGGEWFWGNEIATAIHDVAGRVVGFTKISRDLTERRQAEMALRASAERYRLIVEGARDYAIFTLDPAGRIDGWATGAEAVFGWTADEVIGQPWAITLTEEDHARGMADEDLMRARTEGVATDVGWHQRKDGRQVFIEGTMRALRDANGAITGFLKIGQDVTERHRLEAEQERLAVAEAVAAERQEVLRRVVHAQEEERRRVAHEVHDSVTQLASAAALRLDDLAERLEEALPSDDVQDLERARELVRRAAAESRRLIAGLRPEALDDFGLAGAVGQEVEWLRAEGWRVSLDDGDLVGVRQAPEVEITLYRVVQEALTNVRKHTQPGTRVQVRLRRVGGTVRLEVRDWGRGFDPQAVQAGVAGQRVGLTGMRERLALLGGTISVRSIPGHGTTIRAEVPLHDG